MSAIQPGHMALPQPKIEIAGLAKQFTTRHGVVRAIEPLDLQIAQGEFCVVVGPSGCGKTTLLRILAGLEAPSSGHVEIRRTSQERPLNAMVFQEQAVFPWMTVWQNVAYGLENRGVPRAERDRIVGQWVEMVGLSRFRNAYPHQLSGGMRQRVSIARAFVTDPEVLLMDEPFSALDEQNRTILQQELLRLWEDSNKTVVFITHSIDEAIILGDRIVVMTASPGRIKDIIEVPFPRPRNILEVRGDPRYGELQVQIWQRLADEVQKARSLEGSS